MVCIDNEPISCEYIAEISYVVGIAAVLASKLPKLTGPIATLITGRNTNMEIFTKIMNGEPVTLGNYTVKSTHYRRK